MKRLLQITLLPWFLYYGAALGLAVTLVSARTAEAHGTGCCDITCSIWGGCVCPPDVCVLRDNFAWYYSPSCQAQQMCREWICWYYTTNYGQVDCYTDGFLCCNSDHAVCVG